MRCKKERGALYKKKQKRKSPTGLKPKKTKKRKRLGSLKF